MKKETQWQKLLKLLEVKPMSTIEITANYICAPQKVVETLRKKGYNIETKPVKGQKYCIYILKTGEETQLGLFR